MLGRVVHGVQLRSVPRTGAMYGPRNQWWNNIVVPLLGFRAMNFAGPEKLYLWLGKIRVWLPLGAEWLRGGAPAPHRK